MVKALKSPNSPNIKWVELTVGELVANVEALIPRNVSNVLRRAPVVVISKTTHNTRNFLIATFFIRFFNGEAIAKEFCISPRLQSGNDETRKNSWASKIPLTLQQGSPERSRRAQGEQPSTSINCRL